MRTIEPSTKGPDGGSGSGSCSAGAVLFLLLGTSDDASLGRALLEATGLGVAFLLGVAILASPPPLSSFRSHQLAARRPGAGSRANCPTRDNTREPARRMRSATPAASAAGPAPPPAPCRLTRGLGGLEGRGCWVRQTGLSFVDVLRFSVVCVWCDSCVFKPMSLSP